GQREQRRQPAEEDKLLAPPMVDVPREEVADPRRVRRHLVERSPARLSRAHDHGLAYEDPRANGGDDAPAHGGPERARADERVQHEERNRSERQMHLSRQRDRRQRDGGDGELPRRAATGTLDALERER